MWQFVKQVRVALVPLSQGAQGRLSLECGLTPDRSPCTAPCSQEPDRFFGGVDSMALAIASAHFR